MSITVARVNITVPEDLLKELKKTVPKRKSVDKYLVDSDVVIWFLKGREKEVQLLKNLSRGGELYCSVVTIAEVRAGLTRQPEKIISQLVNIFVPLEINLEI